MSLFCAALFLSFFRHFLANQFTNHYACLFCSAAKVLYVTSHLSVPSWTMYCKLTVEGVVLAPNLLSRLLDLCSEQTLPLSSPFIKLPKLAHELMERIAETQGSCSDSNYCALFKTLTTCKEPLE